MLTSEQVTSEMRIQSIKTCTTGGDEKDAKLLGLQFILGIEG